MERIGYRMPDFSSLKIEALREHSLDVPWVSERHATFNQMDVVRRRVWYESNVYLFLLLYERFLIFFICPLVEFAPWLHLCLQVACNTFSRKLLSDWVCLGLRGSAGPEDDNMYLVLREIKAELGHW
jgi:hypothetical protein